MQFIGKNIPKDTIREFQEEKGYHRSSDAKLWLLGLFQQEGEKKWNLNTPVGWGSGQTKFQMWQICNPYLISIRS